MRRENGHCAGLLLLTGGEQRIPTEEEVNRAHEQWTYAMKANSGLGSARDTIDWLSWTPEWTLVDARGPRDREGDP